MADSTSERINSGSAGVMAAGESSPTEPAIDHIRDALRDCDSAPSPSWFKTAW